MFTIHVPPVPLTPVHLYTCIPNTCPPKESVRYNFVKRNESEVHDYGVEYDYGSIMHYGRTFFSIDGKSTTLLPLKHGVTIGQRLALSELDVVQANLLYMCRE